jgi:ATP-dependent protease ClpP protease subunit
MKILQLLRDNAGRTQQPFNLVRNSIDEATVYIYDLIDSYWGVSASGFITQLDSVADAKTLHVRFNSPGGDVFQGKAIAEAIKRFNGKTIAHIDSLAASAATSIAIACDEVEISQDAFFMIHNASGAVWGDKQAMRDTADLLEKVEGSIVAGYVNKTGKDAADIVAWMDAETWFTADEAVANGFCDRLAATADKAAKNTWNLAAYNKVPKSLTAAPDPATPPANPAPKPTGTTQTNRNALHLKTIV